MRILTILVASILFPPLVCGQVLKGTVRDLPPQAWLTLFDTRGATHVALDSAQCGSSGRFKFGSMVQAAYAGFYQLAVGDTDRVDIILDPREPEVVLEFTGTPLREHITVVRSEENLRLWEYKAVSREAQAIRRAVEVERRSLGTDQVVRSRELDTIAARADAMKIAHLDRLVRKAPDSYFARVVQMDRAVLAAQRKTPRDVLNVFPFDDESLLHCAVYEQAVLAYLRNLDAVSERQFISATDTLIVEAGTCVACRSFLVEHLVEVFGTYGPDLAFQHVLDRYLSDTTAIDGLSEAVRRKVENALRVRIGSDVPELRLPSPVGDTVLLSSIYTVNRATMLFFYSSGCDHCHDQMPGLRRLYARFRNRGLQIVGISLDEDPGVFMETIQNESLIFPCFSEFRGWSSKAAEVFAVQATPSLFLIDGQGKILAKPIDHSEAEALLTELLP